MHACMHTYIYMHTCSLGRHIGRTSVPMIFFKGKYIGGCEDGVDDNEAPGLVPLALKGVLHAKLESIGAFRN